MHSQNPSFLPFALPDIGEEEIAEVVDTLRSGWITTGPKARRFEQDFAASSARLQAIASTPPRRACTWRSKQWASAAGDEVLVADVYVHRDSRGRALSRRRRRC